jgi:pilus assembly protein CpaF
MRLQTLASMSDVEVPFEAVRDQINSAVDCIIQLARHTDGTRKIDEIVMLHSRGREMYQIASVGRFRTLPISSDRIVRGQFEYSPLPQRSADRLFYAGESVPPAFGIAVSEHLLDTREAR